jgi:hypothetical protein
VLSYTWGAGWQTRRLQQADTAPKVSKKHAARISYACETAMTNDPNDILRQIRERGKQQDAEVDTQSHTDTSSTPKDFRTRLAEAEAAANAKRTKRTLTADEQRTLDALQDMQSKIEQNKIVQNRRLQTWLTDEQYASIDELWQSQKDLRAELKDKPDAIKEYEERLRAAIFHHNKADGYRRRGNTQAAEQMEDRCVDALEDLLERYAEMIDQDQSLRAWFDRELDWGHGGDATPDLASVPRPITSTSAQANGSLMDNKITKREVKKQVVERAIDALIYEQE